MRAAMVRLDAAVAASSRADDIERAFNPALPKKPG